jgi:glutaredoxin
MKFEEPSSSGYTIYSKSGCVYCNKSKHELNLHNLVPVVVDCDEYLLEDRAGFLEFIKSKAGKDYRSFPMIFYNGQFIGGYVELKSQMVDVQTSTISFSTDF